MTNNNVHQFDGTLNNNYSKLVEIDNSHLQNNLEYLQCLDEISKLDKEVSDIINQIRTTPDMNLDLSNNINFTDILPRVWKFYRLQDDKCVFFEQILDMKTGLCAQGRTTRMFQLYKIWIDELEKFIKNPSNTDIDIRKIFEKLYLL